MNDERIDEIEWPELDEDWRQGEIKMVWHGEVWADPGHHGRDVDESLSGDEEWMNWFWAQAGCE
jgi:hypothetical protein